MDVARAKLQEAIALKVSDLSGAVTLFGEALEACVSVHEQLAPPCAEFYLQYGVALFELAQNTTGVLGEKVQQKTEQVQDASKVATPLPKQEVMPLGVEAADGGAANEEANEENSDGNESENEESDEDKEAEESDLQLAWELLETARLIYEKQGSDDVASELADTYLNLGDVSVEKEEFAAAQEEFKHCIRLLEMLSPPATRRLAEAHYKLSLCLVFTDLLPEALQHCNIAVDLIAARQAELEEQLAQQSSQAPLGEAGPDAGPNSNTITEASESLQNGNTDQEAIKKELLSLQEVMKDLQGQAEDIQSNIRDRAEVKANLMSALTYAIRGTSTNMDAAQPSAAPAGSRSNGCEKPVPQELGVVGRGKNRITLAPTARKAGTGPASTANGFGTAPPATATGMPVLKGKRNFEALLSGGATGIQEQTDTVKEGAAKHAKPQ